MSDTRTETRPNSAPIGLPAGSFELSDLRETTDRIAAAGNDVDRDALASEELAAINKRKDKDAAGPLPDHKLHSRTTTLEDGNKIVERVNVYDPDSATKEDERADEGKTEGAVEAAASKETGSGAASAAEAAPARKPTR